jgi:excisionase family DNA binding protein
VSAPPEKFLKVREVAAILRVCNMTVYRLIERGELPAARFGHLFRVPESGFREYLAKGRFEAGRYE